MESIITLNNIDKKFGEKVIFEKFSIDIKKQDKILIMGKSGSGKSTLLNILGNLEDIDSGEKIHFGQKNIKISSKQARILLRDKISYLFQNYALIDNDTVFDNLKIALRNKDKEETIRKALIKVGLGGYEKRKVFTLSGGEQQRVALCRIMIKPSKVILADEPTGNLDQINSQVVMKNLIELTQENKALVMVTHDKSLGKYFDRIIEV